MTALQTADGRLLRAQRPTGASLAGGPFFPSTFPPMWSDGERGGDDSAYLKSFEAIYRSQPVVAAVIDKLTRRISTLPLDAYRRLPDDAREIVRGDTLDSLLRRPTPRGGTVHLVAHIMQSMLIHGNAVVAKVRSHGNKDLPPDMLWPLNWAQLSAFGEPGGTIEWWSTSQFGEAGRERYLQAVDTIHFAWPGPDGGPIGVSPLEKLGVTIRLEDAAQREQTSMFRNGSRVSAVVSVDVENPKREVLEFMKERVEAGHRGMDKSGSWLFTGANTKVEPISMTPVEAALVDQRKLNLQEVGMVFDMAGPLQGDMEHGTYSNVEELLRSLYRDITPPWTVLVEQTMQAQMIDDEPAWLDRFVAFDMTDKLKGDPMELSQALKMQVEAGLATRNEARRILNLPAVDDPSANELTANVNNQAPVSEMSADQTPESPVPPASPAV